MVELEHFKFQPGLHTFVLSVSVRIDKTIISPLQNVVWANLVFSNFGMSMLFLSKYDMINTIYTDCEDSR